MTSFGTSGVRGLGTDLLAGEAEAYVRAFARHMQNSGHIRASATVLFARDKRDTSPALAGICAAALAAEGLVPLDCGVAPTPALALWAFDRGDAAIMITGSHIPAERNGLKFYRPDGEIDKSDEAEIQALYPAARELPAATRQAIPTTQLSGEEEVLSRYRARYSSFFPPNFLKGKKIGVYAHSSVAADTIADLVAGFGAAVEIVGASDTFVPIDTEALGEDVKRQLAQWAQQHAFDAILSTDGDGDRPLVTDEFGKQVNGDVLGVVSARWLGAGTIVTPVTSNAGIEQLTGRPVERTKVGSPFVIAGMSQAEEAPVIGFEANGGLLLGSEVSRHGGTLSALPTRDSVLPMLCVLAESAEHGPLSEVVANLGLPVAVAGRLANSPREHNDRFMAWLRQDRKNVDLVTSGMGTVVHTADIDGVQIFLEGGSMIHFRPSGNAPELRCYVQTQNSEKASEMLALGLARAEQFQPS